MKLKEMQEAINEYDSAVREKDVLRGRKVQLQAALESLLRCCEGVCPDDRQKLERALVLAVEALKSAG